MTRFLAAVAVAVAAGWAARADEPAEARKVIDRAVDQVGGAKKLKDLTGGVWKTNGTVRGNPSRADFSGELPGKFRIDSTRVVDGEKVLYSRVVNGDKGWVIEGEKVTPMGEAEIAGVKASFYHKQAATTLVPLTDKEVELSVAGKLTLETKTVTVVKAARKGFPDLLLSFDDATGLLVKSEMTDKDAKTGKDRKVEIEWGNYKEFDGIKMASKNRTYHDGKLFIDTEITDFKGAKNLPPERFQPAGK